MDVVIRNVSIVVIARNEEDRLFKCLDSISRIQMVDCEVICVNSSSTDDTLGVMMAYRDRNPLFTIVSPLACRNAAAARNYGIKAASKSNILFLDGDVELNANFIQAALKELEDSKVGAVSGGLDEIIYDDATSRPITGLYVRHNYSRKMKIMSCGGIFIAKKEAVHLTGIFDERLFLHEDIDYTIRLSRNFSIVALPMTMGTHHTGEYKERPILFLRKGYIFTHGMLARKHYRVPSFWKNWVRARKIIVSGFAVVNLLLFLAVMSLFSDTTWLLFLIFTFLFLLFCGIYSLFKKQSFLSTLIYSLLYPYVVFFGFVIEPYIKNRT